MSSFPGMFLRTLPALLITAATVVQAAPPAASPATDVLPLRATEKTLANGLRVIVVPTGLPNLVSLQIPVQTGSRNEVEPGKSGFAHFFEHMMFRGTKAYPTAAYEALITRAGARQNAYTSDDYTNFHTTFAKEDLETLLKIEADRFQHLDYSEADFKTESRAVLGEYNKNSADPRSRLDEVTRDKAYGTHTYKHTVMGFLADIEDMPNQYAYSRQFFDRWYRPEHTAVIVAGDVDPARTLALVEKYWGGWQRGRTVAQVPAEPPPTGPVYAHVPWPVATPPQLWISFRAPGFSSTQRDHAALDVLMQLAFGPASDVYKRLVETQQRVDLLRVRVPDRVDPSLAGVIARVKQPEDVKAVRDDLLRTLARWRVEPVSPQRLADAKSAQKYGLVRSLDTTEAIASTLAQYVHFDRRYATLNEYYRLVDGLTPADLQDVARRVITDDNLVVSTLSNTPLPEGQATWPQLVSLEPPAHTAMLVAPVVQRSALPQITFKLMFSAGSAQDPPGKEGLAALTAAMVAQGGSQARRASEITQMLFPMAGSFRQQVDKELTTFTGSVHRDLWPGYADVVLPQLLDPGFREDDFRRIKSAQLNALQVDLKDNNEEELGKERLQTRVFAGTPYGHPVLGTVAGIEAITLDDVRQFWAAAYTAGAVRIGIAGDASPAVVAQLTGALAALPAGAGLPAPVVVGHRPGGLSVEIVQKTTRATALSIGLPIAVTRAHPDYAALWLAKTWLGEHRASSGQLFKKLRGERGLNYGDYAYIEAFPRGMFQFFPDPNVARRAQLFEIWIRPVAPENARMALRLALHELDELIDHGMSQDDFEVTRDYLRKNVYVMTATQDQRLGYALDAQWYGTPEYTAMMRDALSRLTADDVTRAVRKHLSANDLSVVFITQDAAGLKRELLGDEPSRVKYDAPKPQELLDEDTLVGLRPLRLRDENIVVTPVADVFAR